MARINGFYNVKHQGKNKVMLWTSVNKDNTESISGYWTGHNSYKGNDHDMEYVDEKRIQETEILEILNKKN